MADLKLLLGADISSSVEQINKDIESISAKISKKALPSISISVDTKSLDALSEKIKKITSDSKITVGVSADLSNKNLVASSESANIDAITVSTKKLTSARAKMIKQVTSYASAVETGATATKALLEQQAQQTNYSDKFLTSLQNQVSGIDTYTLKIKNLENSYARIGYTPPDFTELKNSVAELQDVKLDSSNVQDYVIKMDDLESAFKRASAEFQGFARENTANAAIAQREKEVQSLIFRLEELYQTSKKLQNDPLGTSQYNGIMSTLQGGINTQSDLTNARKEIDRLSNSWRENGLLAETWGDKVQKAFSKFGGWAIVASITTQIVQSFRQMISETIKLDTALTELKKVTDETNASYEKFMKNAAKTAKEIGGTYADVVTATADFSKLGYSIAEAEELAKAAIVYKNVGENISDISTASQSIISTMKAFGLATSDAMSIVDRFNNVSNNFAISSSGLGEALLRSASALSSTGNTLDESIALITKMNEILQSPEKVGTAIRTISFRLRNTAGSLEELQVDAEGAADSITKLQTQLLNLTGGKVNILLDNDTFKSTYQILKEISEVWGEITDVDQAQITKLIAGVNQGNSLQALMTNFQQTQDIIDTSVNSLNSAMEENSKFMDSINGRISQFTASFQQLSSTVISSDFLKTIIDSGRTFIEILNKIVETGGTLPTLFAAIGAAMSFKDVGEPVMEGSFQGMNTPTNILSVRTLSELVA